MKLIIEEHQYDAAKVQDVLRGISELRDMEGRVSVSYVGYYYNPTLKDCVFILPKVLLDQQELVFGKYLPEDLIDLEGQKLLTREEHDFIYELAVWIYRAIVVYKDDERHRDSGIILKQNVQQMAKGRLHQCNTFLDILLALQRFNRENQDFFFFVLRNIHSGYNKINWTRTISHSQAMLQGGTPVYLNPVNKKKQINFDEELLVIFFSILNYMHETYGFPVKINVNFPLITGNRFESYRQGLGVVRLRQIKYKYFSDKAQYLWDLCFAFFDQSNKIQVQTDDREYLLAKDFNIVFEAIIDELVAGDQQLPEALKEQRDGKRVDHMYQYQNLTNNEAKNQKTYYIGDSKYYKRGTRIGDNSVYKQFTYARNVIQWNIDLFGDGNTPEQEGHYKLRDEITEGYNVIPNFFISAHQERLDMSNDLVARKGADGELVHFESRQFDNRLYDRDTFLIAHYDVNFLFVVAMYSRNRAGEKAGWRNKVRARFREQIQRMLESRFHFYAMTSRPGVNAASYIEGHFQQLQGKVFRPYNFPGAQKFYSLALDNGKKFSDENEALVEQLKQAFYVVDCALGQNPESAIDEEIKKGAMPIANLATPDFLPVHFLQRYPDDYVVVGGYRSQKHLEWILGKNDRGSLIYNLRLGDVEGGFVKNQLMKKKVRYVILYDYEGDRKQFRAFHVHNHAVMDMNRLIRTEYPTTPTAQNYFCYVFDDEVSLGSLNLSKILDYGINEKGYKKNTAMFFTGSELLEASEE